MDGENYCRRAGDPGGVNRDVYAHPTCAARPALSGVYASADGGIDGVCGGENYRVVISAIRPPSV